MGKDGAGQISVAKELHLLGGAIDALKIATERQAEHGGRDPAAFASAMGGGLALLRERVQLLERVVRRSASPAQMLCRENEAHVGPGEVASDLLIPLWRSAELATRWEYEWKTAMARLERERHELQLACCNEIVPHTRRSQG